MSRFFSKGLQAATLEQAGHFVHQENPQEVNRLILAFLCAQ
jgi:pimeloyl-ACP methyl ester carboxylesterase